MDIPLLVKETELRCRGDARREPYEEVLRAMVLAARFRHEDVTTFPWIEIDFPGDVEHAAKEVFPALEGLEAERQAQGY